MRLLAKGLSPNDVVNAVNTQNLTLPSGTAKIGATEFVLATNGSPDTIAGLNAYSGGHPERRHHLPFRSGACARRLLAADQHRAPERRARRAGVHHQERRLLDSGHRQRNARNCRPPQQILPKDLKITPLFDQSGFVRAAISGVVREALIAACLTAALILLFLGNWRSTCIIAVSIPLSILSSIIVLYLVGETLNIMTLGGWRWRWASWSTMRR
jgi:Cu/Ag efflux pump CusA